MTHDPQSTTSKPCLDDLLATMGITRAQMMEMTADDLFAAAAQWQNAVTTASAEAESFVFPADGLLDVLPDRPAGVASVN
jgi:hypothetical protein